VYADFAEVFSRIFGLNWPAMGILKTFGFLVALGFFAASYLIYLELKRKEKEGIVQDQIKEVTVGGKPSIVGYISNAVLGFFLGFKLVGMFLAYKTAASDPVQYITSLNGNWVAGIVGAGIFIYLKFTEKNKYGLPETDVATRTKVRIPQHQRVGDIAVIAAGFGFLGAKVFNAFENWDYFLDHPIDSLISSSGFTYYGGLICATGALYFASKKWGLSFQHLCDAAAPALIISYGIGRLGCQISGDGDWGIVNSAYETSISGKAIPVSNPHSFDSTLVKYDDYYKREFKDYGYVPKASFSRPSWLSFLPHSFFAYSFPHNVNNDGISIPGCQSNYCAMLPAPVFPTSLYEFLMALVLFGILWSIRKKVKVPLVLFGIYLIFNGLERFLIEKIRVNNLSNVLGFRSTQAEQIALVLILIGILLIIVQTIRYKKKANLEAL
jgi:phosphatidylglycerol---prolipoprotein diacylglyceryl transferase